MKLEPFKGERGEDGMNVLEGHSLPKDEVAWKAS